MSSMAHFFQRREQAQRQDTTLGATQVLPETQWSNETQASGIPPKDGIVITITRQLGSGGAEIGRLVAQKSNLNYVDNEIIHEVARRLGVDAQLAARRDEQTSGNVNHILKAIQSSHPLALNYNTMLGTAAASAESKELAYLRLTQKVILELATQGNAVIVGRGSQFLLHGAPRTLHTYVFAPLPYRIENVMQRFQLNRSQAEQRIKQRDYEHDNYLRHFYGSAGHQPGLYHLLINTSLFSFELAADIILQTLPIVKEMN